MGIIRTLIHGRRDGYRARISALLKENGISLPNPSRATECVREWAEGLLKPEAVVVPPAAPQPPPVSPSPPAAHVEGLPEGFTPVFREDELPVGGVREAVVAGRTYAVANVDGRLYALAGRCLHAGGPLGEGTLDGNILQCPFHGWTYDVTDGTCLVRPDQHVESATVQVVAGIICLKPGM